MNRVFNEKEVQFIKDNVVGKSDKELAELFNKTFNRDVTEKQIYILKKHHHLRNKIYSRPDSLFSEEEKKYILDNIEGKFTKEFLKEFNKKFKKEITAQQIENYKRHNKITSGIGSWFYKGRVPENYREVGSEVKWNGIWTVKTGNPSVYEDKHRYLYRKYKGEIPEGHIVIFADGNKENFDLDNLILVSKPEHFVMSSHGLLCNDKELTKTAILIAQESLKRRRKERLING